MEKILEIIDLRKNYGKTIGINGISFSIERGQVYGLLGSNGSGKTTTLAVIMGIIAQNSGSYRWFEGIPAEVARRRIGALVETPNFYPYLSLFDNLRIVAKIKNVPENDINRVLGIAGLLKRKHFRYNHLSLGMKQRMSLASVLLGDPDMLVLDEPTNGLDPEGFAEVRQIIQEQAESGKTILLASHILDEVEKVCSHVAILKSGEIIAKGKVGELLSSDMVVRVNAEGKMKLKEKLKESDFIKSMEEKDQYIELILKEGFTASDVNAFCYEKGINLSMIEEVKQSLESQFLKLVK